MKLYYKHKIIIVVIIVLNCHAMCETIRRIESKERKENQRLAKATVGLN